MDFLGSLRCDDSYRLTIVNAETLLATLDDERQCIFQTSCGDIQRSLDEDHLNDLLEYQHGVHRTKGRYSFPTPLILAQRGERYALIDGQHRLEAIRRLLEGGAELPAIPIGVFVIVDLEEYDELFLAINKSKPVHIYRCVRDYKEVLRHVEAYFKQHFGVYLKTTTRPRRPSLNVAKLLAYVDDNRLLARLGLDAHGLIREIGELNQCYRLRWRTLLEEASIENIDKHVRACEAKQPANPLYLGLFQRFEWVHRIIEKQERGTSYSNMKHPRSDARQRIPKSLRRKVWEKRCGTALQGKCYACHDELSYDCFDCGHVVAVVDGGASALENLEPVCRVCNVDMGVTNLHDYRSKLAATND